MCCTERPQDELGIRRELDRLSKRLGQLVDPQTATLIGSQVVEVALHRVRQLVAVLDALQTGLQQDGEREVGVAGRIGTPQFHPRRSLLAWVIERHPDERERLRRDQATYTGAS